MKTIFLAVFVLAVLALTCLSQTDERPDAYLTITGLSGKIAVSGTVVDKQEQIRITDILERLLSPDISTEGILIRPEVRRFGYFFERDLKRELLDPKRWSAGVLHFSTDRKDAEKRLVETVFRTEVRLTGEHTNVHLVDRSKRATLLYLYATWCGPCRAELPAILDLQEKLGPKGLDVILLNADRESDKEVKKFLTLMKTPLKSANPARELIEAFLEISEFSGIPQSFVFADGKLIHIHRGASPAETQRMKTNIFALFEK